MSMQTIDEDIFGDIKKKLQKAERVIQEVMKKEHKGIFNSLKQMLPNSQHEQIKELIGDLKHEMELLIFDKSMKQSQPKSGVKVKRQEDCLGKRSDGKRALVVPPTLLSETFAVVPTLMQDTFKPSDEVKY